jgi:hypothetical protein
MHAHLSTSAPTFLFASAPFACAVTNQPRSWRGPARMQVGAAIRLRREKNTPLRKEAVRPQMSPRLT